MYSKNGMIFDPMKLKSVAIMADTFSSEYDSYHF